MLLKELKQNNETFFSEANRKFFNDRQYWVKHSKLTGEPYLLRSTYAWTGAFGGSKKLHYRLNPILAPFKIGPLVEEVFNSLDEVIEWLWEN